MGEPFAKVVIGKLILGAQKDLRIENINMNIKQIKSPNFSFREGHKPLIAVIHIAEGDKKSVISEFSSFSTQKSSHYLVCKDGEIIQFVPENLSAWTQGFVNNPTNEIVIQHTKSRININQISISLEH